MCTQKAMTLSGRLVTIEGIDRAGKSSTLAGLPCLLQDCKVPVSICGELCSPLAPVIRDMLQEGSSAFLKTFLFASDRAWTYELKCLPSLRRGELVLWDRYVDSAIVYRATELSQSVSLIDLDFVREINRPFPKPDLVVYVDISVDVSIQRAEATGIKEPYGREFLEIVRAEYQKLALREKYCIINGEQPIDSVRLAVAETSKQGFQVQGGLAV
jgi:dTMP kinase